MGTIRSWALLATSAVAIVLSGAALWSLFGPPVAPGALVAGVAVTGAVCLAALAAWRARKAFVTAEKTSSDLDILARRLLRLESRLAEIERHPHSETRKTVAEVSGEIALLSGLLRDLAATVSGHDRDVATLAEEIVHLRERAGSAGSGNAAAAMQAAPVEHDRAHSGDASWARQLEDLPAPQRAPTMGQADEAQPPAGVTPSSPPANDRNLTPGSSAISAPSMPAPSRGAQHHRAVEDALFGTAGPADPDEAAQADTSEAVDPREAARRKAVIAAFRADRLELHLQPVVTLPQRKTRFYEALARLRLEDETLLEPADFLPVLEEAGLAPELDGKIAARAAAVARHLINRGSDAFVTCNLSPVSVRTPGFLRAVGRILEAYPDVLGQFAFEIAQRSWRTLDAETAGALENLRARGAFFVLDRAEDLRLDPLTLADRGVAYAKLPATMLLDPKPSYGLDFEPADLAVVMARAGIKLVAEKVEQESWTPDLIDLEIPLAQGFALGMPRAVRSDILGGARARSQGPVPSQGARPQAPAARSSGKGAGTAAGNGVGTGKRQPAEAGAVTDPDAASRNRRGDTSPGSDSETSPEPRLPYRAFLRRAV
jgi:cyclic-di-GMP phosphodiesterase TipF (flagellum assembly factor)